ncbi:hypothetical protein N6H14_09240 [Paenibacillus sp. CC-CFT747]|nr:hypothetical protein N6H14_09240 [Paenibacillus sp. CC-CFT747]
MKKTMLYVCLALLGIILVIGMVIPKNISTFDLIRKSNNVGFIEKSLKVYEYNDFKLALIKDDNHFLYGIIIQDNKIENLLKLEPTDISKREMVESRVAIKPNEYTLILGRINSPEIKKITISKLSEREITILDYQGEQIFFSTSYIHLPISFEGENDGVVLFRSTL